jgi:hypothetical protein
VFALTLDAAKNAAMLAAVVFLVGSLAVFWIMKSIIQKLAFATLLLLLAFSAYSQRTSLQDCADKVQGNFAVADTNVTVTDTECEFFGTTVTIKDPRGE